MNIGFYNPYFDGFGGGERYTLTLASHWSKSHQVSLFWDDVSIKEESKRRFGIDLKRVRVVPNIFLMNNGFLKAIQTLQYDLIFFLSDGSVPLSFAKRNILHFQLPFEKIKTTPFHLKRMSAIVCNSMFTKENLDAVVGKKATVIYPPTDSIGLSSKAKENIILSIGRFTSVHTSKKQKELIDAFIPLEQSLKGWRLVLAGGLLSSDQEYFNSLQELVSGHAIDLLPNISHEEILSLYKKASLYWHAAGFGETNPRFMEHFGISTVEAMSAGVVPIVYKGGGQLEIVKENENGLLWETLEELTSKTYALIQDTKAHSMLSKNAKKSSVLFSTEVFTDAYDKLLDKISISKI